MPGGGTEARSREYAENETEREIDEREVIRERVGRLPLLLLDQFKHLRKLGESLDILNGHASYERTRKNVRVH